MSLLSTQFDKLDQRPQTFLASYLLELGLMPALQVIHGGAGLAGPVAKNFPSPHPFYWLPQTEIQAFDPDAMALRKLESAAAAWPSRLQLHPVGLSNQVGTADFFETIDPRYSGFLSPRGEETKRYLGLSGYKVHRTTNQSATTLEKLAMTADLLCLEVNGMEVQVLSQAEQILRECLVLVVSEHLSSLYDHPNSAIFLSVSTALPSGWQHHQSIQGTGARLAETHLYIQPQPLSTREIYFPTLERVDGLTPPQLLKLAVLTSLYDGLDWSEHALRLYDERCGTELGSGFRAAFLARFHGEQTSSAKPSSAADTQVEEEKPPIFLSLVDGVMVSVPDRWDRITPYVLREQGDWFERELPWLRRYLQPGMRVLDIGANYGIYSLVAAQAVGSSGRVWSVEPTPSLQSHLQASGQRNNFSHLTVHPLALSLESGEATFYLNKQSELNSLMPSGGEEVCLRVPTQSLDAFAADQQLDQIDFIKLDAEGEEVNILSGGSAFLAREQPLLMFEFRHGARTQLELVDKLIAMGFQIYRLLPDLGLLIPFDRHGTADLQNLNLFGVKPELAGKLQLSGLLATTIELPTGTKIPEKAWSEYLSRLPYGQVLAEKMAPNWAQKNATAQLYEAGLNAFTLSLLPRLTPNLRAALLHQAFTQIFEVVEKEANLARLLSLARIAQTWGRHDLARNILHQLVRDILSGRDFYFEEPLLCPAPEFDHLEPRPQPSNWLLASIFHQSICASELSGYFRREVPLRELQQIKDWGYLLPSLERRWRAWEAAGRIKE